jgi:lysine 2,3-aminomutase
MSGGGKVPINPGYILYHDNEKIVIRNYEGEIFEYPETGGITPCNSRRNADITTNICTRKHGSPKPFVDCRSC